MYLLTQPTNDFESVYLKLRQREGRVYQDKEVLKLPDLPRDHLLYGEWMLRKRNTFRIAQYISEKRIKNVLDVGCGNGWFTSYLARTSATNVLGLDINRKELNQAVRLFSSSSCHFAYGDIFQDILPSAHFDQIILNSSVQYFQDLDALLGQLFNVLKPDGEIHILDSPIYDPVDVSEASRRTRNYYASNQAQEMSRYYSHHTWEYLDKYSHRIRYNPSTVINKLLRWCFGQRSPFYWIIIQPNNQSKESPR